MTEAYLKYREKVKAETTSLLTHLLPDWTVIGVHDGEEYFKTTSIEEAVGYATAVEEAYVWIKNGNWKIKLFLVYGNGPGELICDYSWTKGTPKDILDAFEAKIAEWSDKQQEAANK